MSKKQSSCLFFWDFRMNEDYATLDQLKEFMPQFAKKFVFQLEKGEDNDYKHWQGRMSLHKKARQPSVRALFTQNGMKDPNYCQPTHDTSTFSYVMKTQTRILGPFRDGEKIQRVPEQYQLDPTKFYPYQKVIYDSYNVSDDRIINFVYCPDGNFDNSCICHYMSFSGMGYTVPPFNDAKRLMAFVCDTLYEKKIYEPRMFFVDLPRAMKQCKLAGMYAVLESIKKGVVYDSRYHARKFYFDSPQIWVFSNEKPYLRSLSKDRWKIWKVNEKKEFEAVDPAELLGKRKESEPENID